MGSIVMRVKLRNAVSIAVGCGCVCLFLLLTVVYSLGSSPQQIYYRLKYEGAFNRNVWLKFQKSDEADNPRGWMAEYVRDQIVESGMLRHVVVERLGPPDTEKLN